MYLGTPRDSQSYAITPLIRQTSANLKVELDLPDSPEAGKSNVFNIRFLDNQDLPQGHIDYKYHILKGGLEVTSSSKTIHSESGISSFSYNFDSSGSYEVIIEVEGILFQPISPETVEFSVAVTPEFPFSAIAAISGMSTMMAILARRMMMRT